MERGEKGYPLCRFCNEEVSSARRTFCSNGCVHEHRVRAKRGQLALLPTRRGINSSCEGRFCSDGCCRHLVEGVWGKSVEVRLKAWRKGALVGVSLKPGGRTRGCEKVQV